MVFLYCPKCGAEITDLDTGCQPCREKLARTRAFKCPKCGELVPNPRYNVAVQC
jgi:predicted RNA-binding Zn-ribbon protein involved in translation (DUF1610 family)